MEKFDFDTIIERRNTGSYKWDTSAPDQLPMWVADMDFRTAPCVIDALRRRVDHGVFGYTYVGSEYYDAVVDWFKRRHGWTINPSTIIYTSGVVPAISAILKAVTRPGDKVIVQTPAYNCFFSSIRNDECRLVANPLLYNESDGSYSLDFNSLRRLAADPEVKAMILCNPHNPSGRVWTRDELMEIAEICVSNDLFVIADEIHCELVYPPFEYTPYSTLGERFLKNCAICVSPSKAFNTAGLQIANIIAADPEVRRKIDRAININEVCDVNPFGVVATVAAYNEGELWLKALLQYLKGNYQLLVDRLHEELPALKVTPIEGTYLAWINVCGLGIDGDTAAELLQNEAKLRVNPGSMYGDDGADFIRINLAAPRSVIADAVDRMINLGKSL
ncbi:MAG: pyridoxal phosphate-dependent aminotransferase [Bacteroides sp.]|nr:pyridoxal phosphate-dependent aminotransferase [Bacteroides sp.]MCM1412801.1 pyridoxal phosphate-dependent aminotransferase [Bacteroides sp.]MCM1470905.1 pyridoxal phosphate-dependent aminotransferase [Bacteroides sp.]